MRKFTLLIASLFITIGAIAQTVVTSINTEKYYTLKCKAADHAQYIGVTDAGEINGRSTTAVRIKFEAAEGGYYIKAGDKYLNNSANGSALVTEETGKTVWTLNTPGHTSGVVTFGCGSDYYLNNNYTGGTPYLKSNYHNGGPGSGNACSLWEMREYEPTLVLNASDFVNGKVYTFVTQRGAMGTTATSANAISTARTTVSDTNTDYFKWTVYKSAKGNFYLYNLGKAMFLGEMSTTANASVPMSENPVAVTFKTTALITHPIMFTTKNDGSCVANHSSDYGEGLITWNGGWTNLTDTGNGHQVVEVADLDAEILSTVEAAVYAFEAAFAISNQLTAAELMAKTEPTYIAIKNLSRTNNRWFVGNTGSVPYSEEEFTNDAVFVWEPVTKGEAGSYRLKKLNGDYMQTSAPKDFGTVDEAAAFTATAPGTEGTFNGDADANPYISGSNDANLVRFVKGANWINVQAGDTGTPTYNTGPGGWTIHYVYELTEAEVYTASITNAGYSTFYVPANVEIPGGVKAYYITSEGVNNGFVSLTEISGVVPANTAVVLEGAEGEYTFNVSDADAAAVSGNLLKGTFASTNVTENAYVLSNPTEGVGFYKAATKEVSHSAGTSVVFLNNAGKAYLPASALPAAAQASNGFRFGEGTTGIEQITDNREQSTVIYDLTGRRIEAITAPGIYVVNGKKVLVK
ncbi:MAG: hypothetical protein IKJ95_00770 [Bacteroidaceae bacterium]|nr:hypothetical protein [Bacteroidaceae bacterium]